MVNKEQVEAGNAFGCTSWQLLFKVQLPIALPSIMAGVNQTIMMALSMVIIASMVGAGGLGNDVLASIQRLDVGLGFESGLAVVLLGHHLDRITESLATRPPRVRQSRAARPCRYQQAGWQASSGRCKTTQKPSITHHLPRSPWVHNKSLRCRILVSCCWTSFP
jgi:glycine betaine/proline transport system permease protein